MTKLVSVDTRGRVATVTLTNPPMNTLTADLVRDLGTTLDQIEADGRAKAVILTGGDGIPPFGADPAVFTALRTWQDVVLLAELGHRTLRRIETFRRPVIAALNDGTVLGGAWELALSCHTRVAREGTVFSHPETSVSMMPGWGNTQRLTRIAGASSATEIILTGRQVSAREALALRLVNRVVANSDVMSTATELAETIASKRTVSIESTMAAIGQQWHPGLLEGLAVELSQFGRAFSPDHLAPGLEAFLAASPVDYTNE